MSEKKPKEEKKVLYTVNVEEIKEDAKKAATLAVANVESDVNIMLQGLMAQVKANCLRQMNIILAQFEETLNKNVVKDKGGS